MTEENVKKFDWDAFIAELEAKKRIIDYFIANAKVIQGITETPINGSIPTIVKEQASTPINSIENDTFFNLEITQAIKKYLNIVKRTKSLSEIKDALLKGGFQTKASNFYKTLHATLFRQKDSGEIVQVKKEWGLREWYEKK